ncbi:ribosome assembly factor SBDS [Candidatus Woesearchaeota archaeon]|nr:ribosome assembly factor SBDS [Candidatus Woesearchaeota archaeon]
MTNVTSAVEARIKKQGKQYEILVDCDKALAFRQGKKIALDEVMVTADIFHEAKRGIKPTEKDLLVAFNTTDVQAIALIILKEGEIQLTQKHREKEREEKKKRIIDIIHRQAIDTKTNLPHPPARIEAAMEQAKVKIDENKSAEEQVEAILTALKPIIPIKFETRLLEIKIAAQYAGTAFRTVKKYKLIKSEWLNDGALLAQVEIPAGLQEELFAELNKITQGSVESKILKTI